MPRPPRPLAITPPLRIAILAGPSGRVPLDLERERRELLAAWRQPGSAEVIPLRQASVEGLREELLDGGFHVLHYMGHGSFDGRQSRGELLLDGRAGAGPAGVPGELLAQLVRGVDTLMLVVLNACETGRSAGVGPALVRGGLPAVVAMQRPIADEAAIRFSQTLYRRLAKGDPLDAATTEARLALHAAEPGSAAWAIPVLFLRSPDGEVFELPDRQDFRLGLENFWREEWRTAAEHRFPATKQDLISTK